MSHNHVYFLYVKNINEFYYIRYCHDCIIIHLVESHDKKVTCSQ